MAETKYHINDLVASLEAGKAVVFLGSGISLGARLPDWPRLLKDLIALGVEKHRLDQAQADELNAWSAKPDYLMLADAIQRRLTPGPPNRIPGRSPTGSGPPTSRVSSSSRIRPTRCCRTTTCGSPLCRTSTGPNRSTSTSRSPRPVRPDGHTPSTWTMIRSENGCLRPCTRRSGYWRHARRQSACASSARLHSPAARQTLVGRSRDRRLSVEDERPTAGSRRSHPQVTKRYDPSMQAACIDQPGPAANIQVGELPLPTLQDDPVLVRVGAVTVNHRGP